MSPATADPAAAPSTARRVLVVLLGFVVLGVVCGVVWWLLVHPAEFTKTKAGGSMGEIQLGRRFGAAGWYVVVAVVAGLASGVVPTWRGLGSRSADPAITAVLVAAGSVVAAAVMAYVGLLLGPANPSTVLAHAPPGTKVPVQLSIPRSAWPVFLSWPVASLAGCLGVLWTTASPRSQEPTR